MCECVDDAEGRRSGRGGSGRCRRDPQQAAERAGAGLDILGACVFPSSAGCRRRSGQSAAGYRPGSRTPCSARYPSPRPGRPTRRPLHPSSGIWSRWHCRSRQRAECGCHTAPQTGPGRGEPDARWRRRHLARSPTAGRRAGQGPRGATGQVDRRRVDKHSKLLVGGGS